MPTTDLHVEFWNWFLANLDRFNRLEDDHEALMGEISDKLHKIDENLALAVSVERAGTREFVISADGMSKDRFPTRNATG